MNYFYIHFLSLLGLFGASLSLSLSPIEVWSKLASHPQMAPVFTGERKRPRNGINRHHSDISPSQPVAGPRRQLKPRPSNVALGDYVAAVWGLQRWVLVGSHMGLIVGCG